MNFNPRPSREGRRSGFKSLMVYHRDFNPRPSREGRPRSSTWIVPVSYFNPRPSREGRRRDHDGKHYPISISIHAPRGRGDFTQIPRAVNGCGISIHAPRGRGDFDDAEPLIGDEISIHAPRGRGDLMLI